MSKTIMPPKGKNTTAIFNPKTKSQNTNADTKSAKQSCSKKSVYPIDADEARKNDPVAAKRADKVNSIGKNGKSGSNESN